MFKWILTGLLIVVLLIIGYRLYNRDEINAQVAAEVRAEPAGERARRVMLVTLADGRMYPVNFLRENGMVFMGIDGRWWRAFVGDGQPIEMFIQGQNYRGHAKTILDDPDYVDDVFSRLRPTVPGWLPDWLNGKLVEITLEQS